jgi:16S rRNA G1207 methylase RsmC
METWQSPVGPIHLGRHPYDQEDRGLRAWNGADCLLAEHLAAISAIPPGRLWLLNDHFGALASVALHLGWDLYWQNDSWLARVALLANLACNGLAPLASGRLRDLATGRHGSPPLAGVNLADSLSRPAADWPADLVLLQLPKSLLMLEFQLQTLATCLPAGTAVVAGAMTRDVHNSTLELFEKYLGPTTTSLAAHKARLVHSALACDKVKSAPGDAPASVWPRRLSLAEPDLPNCEIVNHAGVFSAQGHDRGSLFLLHYLADTAHLGAPPTSIIDCGCGNGLLSLVAAQIYPGAKLACADESWMAVVSARAGFALNGLQDRGAFHWTDALGGLPDGEADLVLCNPPFHHGQSQTLAIAGRMFTDAKRCLRPGGRLLVVANRHLGYHKILENLFGKGETVADNGRFVVLSGIRAENRQFT